MCDIAFDPVTEFAERIRQKATADTIRYYLADVQHFLQWLQTQGVSFDQASQRLIQSYVSHLTGAELTDQDYQHRSYAPSTIRRKVSAISAFYAMCVDRRLLKANPTAEIRRRLSAAIQAQQRSSKAQRPTTTPNVMTIRGIRDKAALALLTTEGLKVGQLHQLNVADANVEAGVIRIARRNGKRDTVILSDLTNHALIRWLKVRHPVQNGRDEAVFLSVHWTTGRTEPGARISKRGLHQLVKGYFST